MPQQLPVPVRTQLANLGLTELIPYLESGGLGTIIEVTGSRDFANSDNGATLVYNGTDDIELNLVPDLAESWQCAIEQMNTGVITFTATSPVTFGNLNSDTSTGGVRAMVAMIQDKLDRSSYSLSGATAP